MPSSKRTAMYFAPSPETFTDLCTSMGSQPEKPGSNRPVSCVWKRRSLTLQVELASSVVEACSLLESRYYNLVVVDCRHLIGIGGDPIAQEQALFGFLAALAREQNRERRYPYRRVLVLVGNSDEARVDDLIFRLGRRRVGGALRDFSVSPTIAEEQKEAARGRLVDQFWSFCDRVLLKPRPGKKAMVTAGGGITGIYYELGVVKCLHDSFNLDITDLDMYFGISGGAVVSSCLANGVHIDDLIRTIGNLDSAWKYKLRLSWRHLNITEVPRRLMLVQRELVRYLARMVRREDELSVASLLGTYSVLLGPIFDHTELEKAMRDLFSRPGRSDDFRELRRKLYIGASDQDRREHVLFGEPGYDDVPISKAIRASAAMHPFFPSVEIKNRRYTDGIVTRTSNLGAAIDKGADLVFVIDPFVPLIAEGPGFNARHGNMWIMEQDYKTLSYTRYEQARNEIVRRNPGANVYTFVPSNRMRRLMAGQNPFVSRHFHAILCEAYRSTYRRLKALEYKVSGELVTHGMRLDLSVAEATVQRLREARKAHVRLLLGEPADATARGPRAA